MRHARGLPRAASPSPLHRHRPPARFLRRRRRLPDSPGRRAPYVNSFAFKDYSSSGSGVLVVAEVRAIRVDELDGPLLVLLGLVVDHVRMRRMPHLLVEGHEVLVRMEVRRRFRGAGLAHFVQTAWKQILRRVRAESSRRPPRHRRDAGSMAWRCRFLAADRAVGRVIAKK